MLFLAQAIPDLSWIQHGVTGLLFLACAGLVTYVKKTLDEKTALQDQFRERIATLYEAQIARESATRDLLAEVRDVLRTERKERSP